MPPPVAKMSKATRAIKTFSVEDWTDEGQGQKILLYAPSGMGKTTLATMAPNPIFIGLDDGGRKARNPITGAKVRAISGIETLNDMRDALHQADLWPAGSTCVIDTVTKADELGEAYTLENVKNDKNELMHSLEEYGWAKGYRYQCETMRLLLADLDPLVRRGVNVLMLAQQSQATVSNLAGTDYSQDGPMLTATPKAGPHVRGEFCAWVDYIFRIGYQDVTVTKAGPKSSKGKVSGTTDRVIFTAPQLHYIAKARPLSDGTSLAPLVSFANEQDDSLWTFLFGAK